MRRAALVGLLTVISCGWAKSQQTSYLITTVVGSPPAVEASVVGFAVNDVAAGQAGVSYFSVPGENAVFKVDTTGLVTRIAGAGAFGFSGDGGAATGARLSNPIGVAVDSSGSVYIADENNNRVRKVDVNGIITTVAGSGVAGDSGDGGPATQAHLNSPVGLALDVFGAMYIVEFLGNVVRRVDPDGTITTVAGTGRAGFSGDGGFATAAQLNAPRRVVADSSGALYITDFGNSRVRRVDALGVITTVAGNGTAGFSGDGAPAVSARLNGPIGIAMDVSGSLYITDSSNGRIRKVDASGIISTVVGGGSSGLVNGSEIIAAQLTGAAGVAVDASGTIYIADNGNGRLLKVFPSRIIAPAVGGGIGDGGLAAIAPAMTNPQRVAKDGAGNLYISDFTADRIRKVAPNGVITTFAGTGVAGRMGDGGPATNAQLNGPVGLAVEGAGDVYIADYYNSWIRTVDPKGIISIRAVFSPFTELALDTSGNLYFTTINNVQEIPLDSTTNPTLIAGSSDLPTAGFGGDGGPGSSALLNFAHGLAVDSGGNLYIADFGNNRIRKVDAKGIITTVAGTGVAGFSGDGGPATGAQLNAPVGVAVDSAGNLYITDQTNNRIRRVAANGIITTIAGTGSGGYTGDGGLATSAQLNAPAGLAADAAGNLYFTDALNHAVRALTPFGKQSILSVTSMHSGLFMEGQTGAFDLFVSNASGAGPTSGTVTVTDLLPDGLTLTSMSGPGWACTGNSCARNDALGGGSGYPPITVTVNVSATAFGQSANRVSVSGGGGAASGSQDPTYSIAPSTMISSVVNAASSVSGAVAPGEIVTINGSFLGPAQTIGFQKTDPGTLSTTLGGTQVLFDGRAAPMISVQSNQVSAIVPYEVAGQTSTQMQVIDDAGSTNTIRLPVAGAAPGIFTQDSSGAGPGMILNEDGSTNSPANPAPVGSMITIAATGEGQTIPPGVDGLPALGSPPVPAQPISVQIGGIDALPVEAGGAPGLSAGFFQVTVIVPDGVASGASVPIQLTVGGIASQPGVTVSIR